MYVYLFSTNEVDYKAWVLSHILLFYLIYLVFSPYEHIAVYLILLVIVRYSLNNLVMKTKSSKFSNS